MEEADIYPLTGPEPFVRLAAGFYRQVPADELLGPMYPADDLAGAEQRRRDFLIYRFGGPTQYLAERGHPRLRARHFPFAITAEVRDRWFELMGRSLGDAGFPPAAETVLRKFLGETASFLINRET